MTELQPGTPLLRWLIIAIVLHNCEEVWALSLYPEAPREALALLGIVSDIPPIPTLRAGLALFALIPAFILWRATRKRSPRSTLLACMIAAMTASNALVPHILLGAVTGGYVPGLLSALALTLPIGTLVLIEARRRRWLSAGHQLFAIILGIALLPLVLTGFWAFAELVTSVT